VGGSIVLFLGFCYFFAKKKVKERRVGSSPLVIKGENSQKASLKLYVLGSAGFFSNTECGNDIKERGSRTTTDLAPLSFWRGVGGEAFMS